MYKIPDSNYPRMGCVLIKKLKGIIFISICIIVYIFMGLIMSICRHIIAVYLSVSLSAFFVFYTARQTQCKNDTDQLKQKQAILLIYILFRRV